MNRIIKGRFIFICAFSLLFTLFLFSFFLFLLLTTRQIV